MVLLEEQGIIGFILFIPILYKFTRTVIMSKGLAASLLFLGCIMVNIGEAVLFSIAALGLYLWLLIGWALSMAVEKKKLEHK